MEKLSCLLMYFENKNVFEFMSPCLCPAVTTKSDSIGDVL